MILDNEYYIKFCRDIQEIMKGLLNYIFIEIYRF